MLALKHGGNEHRAKNTLALIQAAVRLGASGATDARELAKAVEARVAALARSQSLLTSIGAQGLSLATLIEQEVAPFATRAGSLIVNGPDINVSAPAAQALTMVIHELAAFVAKYGALADTSGRVEILWSLDTGARPTLHFLWREQHTLDPDPGQRREGFGSRLLDTTIGRQLHGAIARKWHADGFEVQLSIPVEQLGMQAPS